MKSSHILWTFKFGTCTYIIKHMCSEEFYITILHTLQLILEGDCIKSRRGKIGFTRHVMMHRAV